MRSYKVTLLSTVLSIALAPSAFAQQTAPEGQKEESAIPAGIDCDAEFETLDVDGDGYLSEDEAQRAYARSRIDGVTWQEPGMSREEYAEICSSPVWAETTPEDGAPFEGANSFTENQARDRAVAWNVTDVSALTKDDMGIWRGTGSLDGTAVSVAIDYKGNVVTSAPNP